MTLQQRFLQSLRNAYKPKIFRKINFLAKFGLILGHFQVRQLGRQPGRTKIDSDRRKIVPKIDFSTVFEFLCILETLQKALLKRHCNLAKIAEKRFFRVRNKIGGGA